MARSKYIYHIRGKASGCLIASFTVKAEAYAWMVRSNRKFNDYVLFRMADGMTEFVQKFETKVEWL